jgi:hypothetical protein
VEHLHVRASLYIFFKILFIKIQSIQSKLTTQHRMLFLQIKSITL